MIKLKDILQESIVGDKIQCDNCNWNWKIADGGDDLYMCHKCGHDNTPKLTEREGTLSDYKIVGQSLFNLIYSKSSNTARPLIKKNKNKLLPFLDLGAEIFNKNRKNIIDQLEQQDTFTEQEFLDISNKIYSNPSLMSSINKLIISAINNLSFLEKSAIQLNWKISSENEIRKNLKKQVKETIGRDAWAVENYYGRASDFDSPTDHLWNHIASQEFVSNLTNSIYNSLDNLL